MAENKIIGYKNIFGFVLPDWVDEGTIRMIVTFLLSAVVMFFVLIFVIWPKYETVNTLKITAAGKQTALESLKSSKEGFDRLNEQIPETTQNLVLQAIPQTYSPENAVFLLRKIADDVGGVSIVSYFLPSGTLFESVNGNTSKGAGDGKTSNFISYPIKISLSAPVEKILLFIDKVETSLPVGVVSDVGMQEVSKLSRSVEGDSSIKMDLEIKFYQAVLKQMDLSKIEPFTDEDLALVQKIAGFTPFNQSAGSEIPPVTNSSGSLFGF